MKWIHRNTIVSSILLGVIVLLCISCVEKKEEIPYEELQERIEKTLDSKYSEIKTLHELLIALELFLKERIGLHKEGIFEKVKDNSYVQEEAIYLINLMEKYVDEHPEIVIPKLITLFQYSGASEEEYLSEVLSMQFVEKPEAFIKSVDKQILMDHLDEDFKNDEFIKGIYNSISRPIFEGYDTLSEEGSMRIVKENLIGVKEDNDFYNFLKVKYGF